MKSPQLFVVSLLCSLAVAQQAPDAWLTDQLQGYWNFNNCTVADSSAAKHLTLPKDKDAPSCVDGINGTALRFQGVDHSDVLEVANTPQMILSKGFTFSVWFKVLGNASFDSDRNLSDYGTQTLLAKSDDRTGLSLRLTRSKGDSRWYAALEAGHCCERKQTATPQVAYGKGGVGLNEWHHLVVTFEKDKNQVKLYQDGLLKSTVDSKEFDLNPQTDLEPLFIGAERRGLWYPFNGLIDEVRVYSRGSRASEALKLYGLR